MLGLGRGGVGGWLCFEPAAVSHPHSPVPWALLEVEKVEVHLKLEPFSVLRVQSCEREN